MARELDRKIDEEGLMERSGNKRLHIDRHVILYDTDNSAAGSSMASAAAMKKMSPFIISCITTRQTMFSNMYRIYRL